MNRDSRSTPFGMHLALIPLLALFGRLAHAPDASSDDAANFSCVMPKRGR